MTFNFLLVSLRYRRKAVTCVWVWQHSWKCSQTCCSGEFPNKPEHRRVRRDAPKTKPPGLPEKTSFKFPLAGSCPKPPQGTVRVESASLLHCFTVHLPTLSTPISRRVHINAHGKDTRATSTLWNSTRCTSPVPQILHKIKDSISLPLSTETVRSTPLQSPSHQNSSRERAQCPICCSWVTAWSYHQDLVSALSPVGSKEWARGGR